jgi:metallo-beta-lactamase class B
MKGISHLVTFVLLSCILLYCTTQKRNTLTSKAVYKSSDLIINQIAPNAFQHISYKQTNDFGNVPCNGLIVRDRNEVIIFDTPANDKSAEVLIQWITETLHCNINAIIPTHFHDDCLGGLKAFETKQIPSYANFKTITLAKENNLTAPQHGFQDSLVLKVGDTHVIVSFFGEGHTKDNVVGYFPDEDILFGGCLVKTLGASKGFVGDANINEWSNTVGKVKKHYPRVKVVVPGHGDPGNQKLLDYTIELFKT